MCLSLVGELEKIGYKNMTRIDNNVKILYIEIRFIEWLTESCWATDNRSTQDFLDRIPVNDGIFMLTIFNDGVTFYEPLV